MIQPLNQPTSYTQESLILSIFPHISRNVGTIHFRKNEKYTAEIARNLLSRVSLQTKPISIVDLRNHYETNLKEPRSRLSQPDDCEESFQRRQLKRRISPWLIIIGTMRLFDNFQSYSENTEKLSSACDFYIFYLWPIFASEQLFLRSKKGKKEWKMVIVSKVRLLCFFGRYFSSSPKKEKFNFFEEPRNVQFEEKQKLYKMMANGEKLCVTLVRSIVSPFENEFFEVGMNF